MLESEQICHWMSHGNQSAIVATDKRRRDPFSLANFIQASVSPVLQHRMPPKRPSDRLDHGVVDGGPRHWVSLLEAVRLDWSQI